MATVNKAIKVSEEVQSALRLAKAIVALESTVITHGLPKPENYNLARKLESIIRAKKAVPATIGLIKGKIHIGMQASELKQLAQAEDAVKLSSRDIASAVALGKSGGTTVAATLRLASQLGISVFATGGIGGIHRGSYWDVSADLEELANQKIILICAGAKAILDLPATLERFETLGIPILGYKTDQFPAFYSTDSGLPVSARINDLEDLLAISKTHWQLGGNGILLAVPPPQKYALARREVEAWINQAHKDAQRNDIHGQEVSPYLLNRLSELSKGQTMKTNLALLENNASVAASLSMLFMSQAKDSPSQTPIA